MKLFELTRGDTKPDITGVFSGVDLTGATVSIVLENLEDGSAPFASGLSATITSSPGATNTTVRWTLPAGGFTVTGEWVGWFVATLSSQQYRSTAFVVRSRSADRTPTASSHPVIYGDGRGGYATVSDVTLLDVRRDQKVRVDNTFLETLLGDTAIELDSSLRRYYVVPITSDQTQAWGYLRIIHKYWALAAMYNLLAPSGGGDYIEAAATYRELGTQMLENLFDGTEELVDATAASEKPLTVDSDGATITDALNADVDWRGTPIFSVDSMRRNWRLY